MPHFSYHLQIFYVNDTTETAKVKKYCLWIFKNYYFLNLAGFHFIFLIKYVYSYSSWERVKELVVVTLHVIMKLAKTMVCCFFEKVQRVICGFEM